jgi:hypothetical protein
MIHLTERYHIRLAQRDLDRIFDPKDLMLFKYSLIINDYFEYMIPATPYQQDKPCIDPTLEILLSGV